MAWAGTRQASRAMEQAEYELEGKTRETLNEFVAPLAALNKEWGELTMKVGMAAMKDREEVGAASVDYLMYSGYVCLAYFWADMARLAAEKLAAGNTKQLWELACPRWRWPNQQRC